MGAEAVLLRIEAMHKKLLAQQMAAQANTLKGLKEDMRKETKRIEATTQAQVCSLNRTPQLQLSLGALQSHHRPQHFWQD